MSNKKGGKINRQTYTIGFITFQNTSTPEKGTALLAIPDICSNKIITLYHSSLFVGHQGVMKTY